jgi:hypothetical protein
MPYPAKLKKFQKITKIQKIVISNCTIFKKCGIDSDSVTLKINNQHTLPPFWRTGMVLYSMELGSVTLKINNQHTHCAGQEVFFLTVPLAPSG